MSCLSLHSFKFQDFGWEKNAGYGTKMHIDNIYRLGPTMHHRKSFEPIYESKSGCELEDVTDEFYNEKGELKQ